MKFIASFFVISIHVFTITPIKNNSIFFLVEGLARIAVPFFFCCNGYFLGQKGIENPQIAYGYIKKVFTIYFLWSIIYIPIEIIKMFATNTFNQANLVHYLKVLIVEGSFTHLWYFPALIFAVFFIYKALRRFNIATITVLAVVLYMIGMLGDAYYGVLNVLPESFHTAISVYETIFITTRNGLFFGVPFVFMGVVISKFSVKTAKLNHWLGVILSAFCLCGEVFVLRYFNLAKDYNMMIFSIPTTLFLFCILVNTKVKKKFNSYIFRKASVLIYESHLLFFGIVLALVNIFNFSILENSLIQYIVVSILTLAFSLLVLKLSQKEKFRFLKALY